MMKRFASLALLATAMMLPGVANSEPAARPMFARLPPHGALPPSGKPVTPIAQWNGSFTDLTNKTINFVMIGADPSTSNVTTTVQVEIIPVVVKYTKATGTKGKFDPTKDKALDGRTVIASLEASPLFDSGFDWVEGGTDLGQSQYVDAFQRGNFWSSVTTNTGYHTVLSISQVMKAMKIKVTSGGKIEKNPFGSNNIGTMSINTMDSAIHSYISKNSSVINPSNLPLFITDNIFLTQGGCCIGGYHSATGGNPNGQTYSYSTFVTVAGSFSSDIDAVSHELSEWLDDPFTNNGVNCQDNSILEVGDPIEGLANYGTFPVSLNGFTWHPQDEVYLDYFGAPTAPRLHGWYSFNNEMTHVCPGQ